IEVLGVLSSNLSPQIQYQAWGVGKKSIDLHLVLRWKVLARVAVLSRRPARFAQPLDLVDRSPLRFEVEGIPREARSKRAAGCSIKSMKDPRFSCLFVVFGSRQRDVGA